MNLRDLWNRKSAPKAGPGFDNKALVHAMRRLAVSDTPVNRKRLYSELLNSSLWIPTPELPKNLSSGQNVSQENISIQLVGIFDSQQRRVTPAFTDEEALRNWDPNTPSIGLPVKSYFSMMVPTDFEEIIINPFDPIRKMIRPGGRITRREFTALAEGMIPQPLPDGNMAELKIAKGQRVLIGLPAIEPNEGLQHAVIETASSISEVQELYLFQMVHGIGSSPHIVFGLFFRPGTTKEREKEIFESLGRRLNPVLGSGSVDLMPLRGGWGEDVRKLGKKLLPS